ncbi:DUF4097 family beta strand repeat-containing protein [Paenibacillus physcomitrellae]|uniref:DUF4097 domain-containing protein n=1 Tax=Paenibacillus physcomitrellae TaxID=1619311 RepID=A0ABQ1GF66_9BACL|nr:DUF4097 family beta strand repeat-containing protein [Paenibacillus physcomitrellae]GGA42523.1 hypothetical protein GCM10010917_29800 [Paenibacillus physcomitrellae]
MNKSRNWPVAVVVLLAIGLAGMAYQHFKFGEERKDFERRWNLTAAQLQSLSIVSDDPSDIHFIPAKEGSGYVQLSGKLKPEIARRLSQTEPAPDGLQLDLSSDSFSIFSFSFRSTKSQITVALPEGSELGRFQLDLKSGGGSIHGVRAGRADLKTSSGRLVVSDVKAAQINLHSSSGKITAEQLEGTITAATSSGGMSLTRISGDGTYTLSSGNLDGTGMTGQVAIQTSSGNVALSQFSGSGQIASRSGNITLSGQRSDSLNITARSGNVKLSKDDAFRGIYDLRASSGSIHAPESPGQTHDVIEIRTRSGNITIR